MRIVIGITLAALLAAAIWAGQANLAGLVVPFAPAVALALVRRYSPARAFGIGALASYSIVVLIALPFMVVKALWSSYGQPGPDRLCWGCADNAAEIPGAAIYILLFTLPIGVAGGIVSAIASLALVRKTESAHP